MRLLHLFGRRFYSVLIFLPFAFIISFFFEGQTFYSMMEYYSLRPEPLLFTAIISHMAGLLAGGFFAKSESSAKTVIIFANLTASLFSLPFFFAPNMFWYPSMALTAAVSGIGVAAWGWLLRYCSAPAERLHTCADALILSNVIMIVINNISMYTSYRAGLALSLLLLPFSALLTLWLPLDGRDKNTKPENGAGITSVMLTLCLFIAIITIDSGLMYQVLIPAFYHLKWLTCWYWAIPYIAALLLMRLMPAQTNRASFLYLGIMMILGSFVAFIFTGRGVFGYLAVDTLMLGACGIFDLFWWSMAGALVDYSNNPARIFGGALAANVGGVLIGDIIGVYLHDGGSTTQNIAVIALAVVCVTGLLLPFLNAKLSAMLKEHSYILAYARMSHPERETAKAVNIYQREGLTSRENEVLELLMTGAANKMISERLIISENTVKFHIKNIYQKYSVNSRAELLALLVKKQV